MPPETLSADQLGSVLSGCRILVAEDEYLIARDIAKALEDSGATVAGPCPEVRKALELLDDPAAVDGAVIDFNLRGVRAQDLAEALQARGIGFVIASGYDQSALPESLRGVPRCMKPIDFDRLVTLLRGQIDKAS